MTSEDNQTGDHNIKVGGFRPIKDMINSTMDIMNTRNRIKATKTIVGFKETMGDIKIKEIRFSRFQAGIRSNRMEDIEMRTSTEVAMRFGREKYRQERLAKAIQMILTMRDQ